MSAVPRRARWRAAPLPPRSVARPPAWSTLARHGRRLDRRPSIGIAVMGWIVVRRSCVRGIGGLEPGPSSRSSRRRTPTSHRRRPRQRIVGTLVITVGAALIGLPLGFFGGVYLAEFGRTGRVATGIRAVTNIVLGVPSIIAGMFAYAILVKPPSTTSRASRRRSRWPSSCCRS